MKTTILLVLCTAFWMVVINNVPHGLKSKFKNPQTGETVRGLITMIVMMCIILTAGSLIRSLLDVDSLYMALAGITIGSLFGYVLDRLWNRVYYSRRRKRSQIKLAGN